MLFFVIGNVIDDMEQLIHSWRICDTKRDDQ